jgi:hypothetical protein
VIASSDQRRFAPPLSKFARQQPPTTADDCFGIADLTIELARSCPGPAGADEPPHELDRATGVAARQAKRSSRAG